MTGKIVAVTAGIDAREDGGTRLPCARVGLRDSRTRHAQVEIVVGGLGDERGQFSAAKSLVPCRARPVAGFDRRRKAARHVRSCRFGFAKSTTGHHGGQGNAAAKMETSIHLEALPRRRPWVDTGGVLFGLG